jgi:hypothetical protein
MEGTTPDCQEITMETTPSSANNNATQQTEFVTQTDITEFDPCMFTVMDNINPVTKKKCVESFRGMKDGDTVKDDYIYKLYLLLLSGLGIYILFNIAYKNKNLKH